MKRHTRSGFTLIELIIVVGIIGILVTVLLTVLLTAIGSGDHGKAKNFVDNIIPEAITKWQEAYAKSNTTFPQSPNMRPGKEYVEGNVELYNELVTKPEKAGKTPFVTQDHYVKGTHKGKPIFVDPWGQPYIYRNYAASMNSGGNPPNVGKTYNATYDIISLGPDKEIDGDDDIARGRK